MDVRFVEQEQFQRAAAGAALGGAAAAALASAALAMLSQTAPLVPAALAGSAFAVALWPQQGLSADSRRRRVALALLCSALGAVSLVASFWWSLPSSGAALGLLLNAGRADAAPESAAPSGWALASAAALAAIAAALAGRWLPPLQAALDSFLPGALAAGAAGGAFGLWAGVSSAPVHVSLGEDRVEARLAALRPALSAELRPLAERAAAARRGQDAELRERPDLRALLDDLALAALELSGKASELGRAAAPALEDELSRRKLSLEKSAAQAQDAAAQQSYARAAEALDGQLEHLRRVRRARERAVARLHEEVANLERARFALTLVKGADRERGSAELDLLQARLQHRALACELDEPGPLQPERIITSI